MTGIKGEIKWVGYYDANGECRFIITSKPARDYYYLYKVEDDAYKKIGRAKSPDTLVENYNVIDVIRGVKCKRKAADNTE